MKELSIDRMELVSGGLSNRDCLVRGAGLALALVGGFAFQPLWGVAFMISATSSDCYN
jgi:hypothetical protein